MIDSRWRKVARDAWLHRGRLVLAVIAIALALAAAGALLVTWALVGRATQSGYRASLPVSATLGIEPLDAAFVARVRALPGVAAARARRTLALTVRVDGTTRQAMLFAVDDFTRRDMALLAPDGGAWPPADGAVVVERSSVDFAGARIGDAVTMSTADGETTLAITGFVRDVSVAPGWMEHVVYAYATPATLARIDPARARDEVQVRVADAGADRDAVRRVAAAVQALAVSEGRAVRRVDVPVPGEHIHAAQMNSLLLVQGAFAALALLFAAFLSANLFEALFARQIWEIGVMKAIGASDRQVLAMGLAQALVPGLLATGIALPVALMGGRWYAALKGDLLNFPMDTVAMPAWVPLLLVALGLLLPVAAALLPLRRVARMGVAGALRDAGIASDGGVIARRASLPGLSRPLLIALNNAFRRRARLALTLLALAGGGAVLLASASVSDSVVASVDELFATQRQDLLLVLAEDQPPGVLAALSGVAGVARAEGWGRARATPRRGDGTPGDELTLLSLPRDSTLAMPRVLTGRWAQAPGELVVSRRVARESPELVPGARVELELEGGSRAFAIVGVADAGPQALAYTPLDPGAKIRVLAIATTVHDEAAELELVARLRAKLAAAGVAAAGSQRTAENRRVVEDHLLMVVDFLAAMGWIMLAVGAIGLASSMSLAVLERTREIGVLRAIGAPHGAIFGLVQAEGLVVALLAWLLAIPLSIPTSVLLAQAFGRVMFPVPLRYAPDATAVLVWLTASIAIALVACAVPAWRALRVPAARALAWE